MNNKQPVAVPDYDGSVWVEGFGEPFRANIGLSDELRCADSYPIEFFNDKWVIRFPFGVLELPKTMTDQKIADPLGIKVLEDADLMIKAKAIREWLSEISGCIPRLNEDPNPFYDHTLTGLTLKEYYGTPSLVGTPFGGWAATGGGSINNDWLAIAKERLGLVVICERTVNHNGEYGPVWGITKDLDGNPLPAPSASGAVVIGNTVSVLNYVNQLQLTSTCVALGCPDLEENQIPSRMNLEYCYLKHAWKKMKNRIGFQDWSEEQREKNRRQFGESL